ncbi:DNA polymerase IV [Rhizobiaceae bacterium]|nr:DNA polymerase IV [Rhizobiaceae bacterium]
MDGRAGFCRDCLTVQTAVGRRCEACASPRLLKHAELYDLSIAHIDCDAFYASVEKRDDPSLADKPVIVGGGTRGVVTTCCYIARINGVRSAMAMFQALKACPHATIVRPRMGHYAQVGRQIREMMRSLTPAVEPLSIDEAFLDLSGTERLHGMPPALTLAHFARRVEEEVGISVSVGLAPNKFLAKIASDFEKPRGFSVIGAEEAYDFLGRQPVSLIWGVGRATQARLAKDNVHMISDLQTQDEADLMRRYGSMGMRLSRLSRGQDYRRVSPRSAAKSVSAETTFSNDLRTAEDLEPILRRLCEKVALRLKEKQIAGQTVVLKLKTDRHRSLTRNSTLPDPTQLADRMFATGRKMLAKELSGQAYRLIGIGLSDLRSDELADPADLVDTGASRRAAAERAMDSVRGRFGASSVELGLTFGREKPRSHVGLGEAHDLAADED